MKRRYGLSCLSLILSSSAQADRYIMEHTGSYLGFISLGYGFDAWQGDVMRYTFETLLGYTPPELAGESQLAIGIRNTLTTKTWYPYANAIHLGHAPLYAGVMVLLSLDRDNFIRLPAHYPRGYYPPTGAFLAPYLGTEVRWGAHGFALELATLDVYIPYRMRNSRTIRWQDIISSGISYRYYF